MTKKKLVVVGGGYLGAELAKSLQSELDVTLIERASHFTHAPAMIRAMVDPTLLSRALIPYSGLLSSGRLVHAEATSVDGEGVTLADGTRIEADYIVLATGSSNLAPFKSPTGDIEGLRANVSAWHAALKEAQSVLIIGAGAVGTELAGEIAHAMPGKSVTLVSSDATLFPGVPGTLGASLKTKLEQMNVTIITGERADNLPGRTVPEGGSVTMSSGHTLKADLVIPAVGSNALTDLAAGLPGAETHRGRVRVDEWMRPSTLPNVFAAGDVADAGDGMTIVAIARQKPWLEKMLKAVAGGKSVEDTKRYAPWGKAPILVPLGPEKGNSFLMAFTAGNFITRQMKGKDLFLAKYNKLLGRA